MFLDTHHFCKIGSNSIEKCHAITEKLTIKKFASLITSLDNSSGLSSQNHHHCFVLIRFPLPF